MLGARRQLSAWADVTDRALAFWRGESAEIDQPVEAPADDELRQVSDDDLDPGSVRHLCEANRRGLTDSRFNQSRAEVDWHVARYRAGRNAKLWRGDARPAGKSRLAAPVLPRVSPAQRPRERRDGSRKHSTRGGTDDEPGGSDPEPPSSGAPTGRLCKCGCGRSIAHKRSHAETFDAACRKRIQRAREVPVRRCEAEGCDCRLSSCNTGVLCWPCSLRSNPENPSLTEVLCGLDSDPTLAEVLRRVGTFPESVLARTGLIATARRWLNVPLSIEQASRLLDMYGSAKGALDALARMVEARRRQLAALDELPELYTLAEHAAQHADRSPSEQFEAFLELPEWQRSEAWAALATDCNRTHELAVSA